MNKYKTIHKIDPHMSRNYIYVHSTNYAMSLVINCYFFHSLTRLCIKIWERANAILTWIQVGQSLEHDIVVPAAIKELL